MSFRGLLRVTLGFSLLLTAAACRPQAAASTVLTENTPPTIPFELRPGAETPDLTWFWMDDQGNAHTATRVDEIPAAHRGLVRIDPVRPEARPAGWVFVADLRQTGPDGRFPVRALTSEQFARELHPPPAEPTQPTFPTPTAPPTIAQNPSPTPNAHGAPQGQPRVIIYGASWCTACHQAAEWLRSQNIPFVEHDIERDAQAAQTLAERARQQGVPIGSIPIIEVGGRLMVGFNPTMLSRALQST